MPAVPFNAIYPDGPNTLAAGGAAPDPGSSDANPQFPGMPAGATPIARDLTVAAAGTYPVWTPSAGRKFVLASAMVSTDTAMRVALVDQNDQQGGRPVDGFFGANGGASPNLVPVPYPSQNAGNVLQLVTSAVGNVKVSVRGWEQ